MENPYQAPVEAQGQPRAAASSDSPPMPGFGGRLSIIFVALIFGAVSASSLIGFAYNLTINYPGTDRPVIEVDPLWMLGHVIRGLGLAVLTWRLWGYQSAIGKCLGLAGEDAQRLVVAHDKLWKTGALVLGALVSYAVVYVAVSHSAGNQ